MTQGKLYYAQSWIRPDTENDVQEKNSKETNKGKNMK